jgi:hypothetical protein
VPNPFLLGTKRSIELTLPSFKHVKIDEKKLAEVAEANALKSFEMPNWVFLGCEPKSNEAFPSHCFFWNAINFCFDCPDGSGGIRKFTARSVSVSGAKVRPLSGSYAMETRFYKIFGEEPITASSLAPHIETFSKFKNKFEGVNSMPLLKERWQFLCECVEALSRHFSGDVMNILEEGGYRAFGRGDSPGVVEILIDFFPETFGGDIFIDSAGYFKPRNRLFYFLKRVQLFVLAYHERALASRGELRPIEGAEEIGPIVDYILPKRYVADGILVYGDELKAKIEKAEPIVMHSQEEIEIRAATFLAFCKELQAINGHRTNSELPPIHTGELDYYRWSRRGGSQQNHHISFTMDY